MGEGDEIADAMRIPKRVVLYFAGHLARHIRNTRNAVFCICYGRQTHHQGQQCHSDSVHDNSFVRFAII